MHPKTEKAIADMRAKVKTPEDKAFVDAMEGFCREYEKPREPIDPFRFLYLSPLAQEQWDQAIRDLIQQQNGK